MVDPARRNTTYTYADLLAWPEDEGSEILDGWPMI